MDASTALAREYSRIAAAYATEWSPVMRPMALPLLDALPLAAAAMILDVGTGTGALLPDIRAKAPRARLVGVDRAEGMLSVAQRAGWSQVAVTDAANLCIAAESVNVALFVFVLFHMPDPVACLREIGKTLAGDGHVGIVCWGADTGAPGAAIWTEELNRAGAAPDTRDPSVVQVGRMNSREKLKALIDEAGLDLVREWSEVMAHHWTLPKLLQFQLTCGVASRRLPSLDGKARAECESRARERLSALSESELVYRPEVLFAIATN